MAGDTSNWRLRLVDKSGVEVQQIVIANDGSSNWHLTGCTRVGFELFVPSVLRAKGIEVVNTHVVIDEKALEPAAWSRLPS